MESWSLWLNQDTENCCYKNWGANEYLRKLNIILSQLNLGKSSDLYLKLITETLFKTITTREERFSEWASSFCPEPRGYFWQERKESF